MQRGVAETRGTLFRNIFVLIEERKPALVILENVRNLIGPKHRKDYDLIITLLRDAGYRVSTEPSVISPHLLPPSSGGRPQSRDRVFITATYVGDKRDAIFDESIEPVFPAKAKTSWNPENWNLERDLMLEECNLVTKLSLSEEENRWIDAWGEFVQRVRSEKPGLKLPGFPIWVDAFVHPNDLKIPEETPSWKAAFLRKNSEFYKNHKKTLDEWLSEFKVSSFPQSRRKFEWQAQDAKSIDETILHFRPSGIRVKKATYVPALVAINQTSIVAKTRRRLSTTETANLQGLPSWFDFGSQTDTLTYKQLGNGVNVGVVWQIMKRHVERDAEFIRQLYPTLFRAISESPESPDSRINELLGRPDLT
jgi:DNA (cytosine-5)-methyltransferase 1